LALGLALCGSVPVSAGPHANAVLIPHLNPQIEYTTSTTSYEGQSNLRDCREAITQGQVLPERAQVWYVIASFANSPGPVNVGGIDFGFASFNARKISFVAYGPCSEIWMEVPTARWPGPNEGTSLAVASTTGFHSDPLEVYWFASYVYEPVAIELGPNPSTGSGEIATRPPNIEDPIWDLDPIVDFGKMGFGEAGYNPCAPDQPQVGACCALGDCRLISQSECEGLGGSYHGTGTDCFPSPCGVAIETTWGTLKKLFD
jgi:hypothetical protein